METIRTHGNSRNCPHCGKRLSRYNPNRMCWSDTSLAFMYPTSADLERQATVEDAAAQWRSYFEMALDALDEENVVRESYREPRAAYWASVRIREEFALTWSEVSTVADISATRETLKRSCYRFQLSGRYQHVTDLVSA